MEAHRFRIRAHKDAREIYSGVLPAMTVSNWRSNVAVAGGVIGGLFLAVWFSSVVAMGPAPGSMHRSKETQQGQTHQPRTKDGAAKRTAQLYTAEYC
jgi:hypothetical protein